MVLDGLVRTERQSSQPPGDEWTAITPDGQAVTVRRLTGLEDDPARRARYCDALSPLTQVRHQTLLPVLAVGERDGAVWVVSEIDRGRPLRRLLAVATLTPEQAAHIVVGILDGLEALGEARLWHGRLDEGTVHVGRSGGIRLGGWEPMLGVSDADQRRREDDEATVRLLGRLRHGVRLSGSRTQAAGAALLETLDACGRQTDDATALLGLTRELAAALLAGGANKRAARELSALVAALEPDLVPRPAPSVPAQAARRRPAPSPAAVWRPARRPHWIAIGLVLLLLAALAGAVIVAERHTSSARAPRTAPVARPTPSLGASSRTPTPAPTPIGPRPVPQLAPAAAGPITAVQVEPLQGSCQPAATCPVQVTVRLQPQPSAQEVRWSFQVIDRCTGATSTLPGVSVTALAGWPYVYGTSWPQLPGGHPVALVAVTETPTAAASPAVLAGGTGLC